MSARQSGHGPWLAAAPAKAMPSGAVTPVAAAAAAGAVVVGVLLLFWPTTASMIDIWRHSDTFQHCFLVVPVALWLIWDQRLQLAATPMRPYWPALVALMAAGCAWVFGQLASAQLVSHLALIAMIAATMATIFGRAWLRVLWFPLAFLVFAVPFGESLVPFLMEWTADFTVAAMRLSGVPVYREAMHFIIPSGSWSVIEACSGIKFLIASLMAGSLYAWLMYRSPRRRVAFMVASLVVPLLANWLRAYAIVMIGHISKNRLMTNDDHIVFGWILFGGIMLLMYWLGARWREDQAPAAAGTVSAGVHAAWSRAAASAATLSVAILIAWPLVSAALMRPAGEGTEAAFVAPRDEGGWRVVERPVSQWQPEVDGAAMTRVLTFERDGRSVKLFVAVYRNQTQAAQLATAGNQLVRTTSEHWKQVAAGRAAPAMTGSALPEAVRTAQIRARVSNEHVLAWQWYFSGSAPTTSDGQAKLDLALARLRRAPDTALWVALATPVVTDVADAQRTLDSFSKDMGPSLAAAFRATVQR